MAQAQTSGLRSLALVNGGLNFRSGQLALKKNQTKRASNVSLLLEGGFTKGDGWTLRVRLPRPIQGLMLYEKAYQVIGKVEYEVLAYNYSSISKVDLETGTWVDLKTNVKAEGRPQYAQDGPGGNLHIVDGANNPIYYNGSSISAITWPPTYTGTNSTQLSSIYATASNPGSAGFPHDCEYYANRMWYIDLYAPGRAYASKAGATTDFQTNNGAPVPSDIALFMDFPVAAPFMALGTTPDGLMFYEPNGTSRLIGKNAPIPGLSDQFAFQKINTTIGCLSPNLFAKMSDNEHIIQTGFGTFLVTLSENFQEVRPGQLSYDIQPELDNLGRSEISRGVLRVLPHKGLAVLATPRRKTHIWNDKIWKYYYGVGQKAKPKTTPWMFDELFGGMPTRISDIIVNPATNKVYIASGTDIYEWTGSSFNGNTIRTDYEFPPDEFDKPHLNKYIKAYHIDYKSTTGATIRLDHAWSNTDSGSTLITLPPKPVAVYDTAVIGTDTYTSRSAFSDGYFKVPISGGQIGKQLIVYFLHESETEDVTIYDIKIEYDYLAEGA